MSVIIAATILTYCCYVIVFHRQSLVNRRKFTILSTVISPVIYIIILFYTNIELSKNPSTLLICISI